MTALELTLISATLSSDVRLDPEPKDIYAIVKFGSGQCRTRTACDHGRSPVWNETVMLNLDNQESPKFIFVQLFAVWSDADELLGVARIPVPISGAIEGSLHVLVSPSRGETGTLKAAGRWTSTSQVKFDRQKAPALLQPLPISNKPWESLDLRRTPTGNDGVWTILCRFSKQAHFVIVRKKIKSEQMVKMSMHNIFKYHGMPPSIISDRDLRMTSLFWKALFENMGTMLEFSSLFHPQKDGQPKEANSTDLDLLKCYVSKHKATWKRYLPLVEYAYNNIVHTSTGKAPFEIVEMGKKVLPILQQRTRYMRWTSMCKMRMKHTGR
ncbi:hypothetical protein L7F22_024814 [Adiantum nelumboides]|nr:hypothetical protein [Adiantum nelumboides]